MRVEPVAIDWHPKLPVFAKESFLKAVGNRYGWLGGFSPGRELRCVLPYTIVNKGIFRMVRFRVETIPWGPDLPVAEEKEFLNGVVAHFRSTDADMVIPATSNAIFRTYPDSADAAPYGTHLIDLTLPEDVLWKNVDRITRQNIKSAAKAGVAIRDASSGEIPAAYALIKDTFRRSRLPFMGLRAFEAYLGGLGEHGRVLAADLGGRVQSYCVFAASDYRVYAVYAGNLAGQASGSNKLLYWEGMRLFRALGAGSFDFFGARIDPERGSKQEALNLFKKRFGATLEHGYIWKCPLRSLKYCLYGLAARVRSGGDIVDAEKHKLDRAGGGGA